MEKKVSPSNTKTEILEAYNSLVKQVETPNSLQPKEMKEKEEQEKTVKTAVTINKEGIIKQIASLKISLNNELEKVEEALLTESKKLAQVHEAIGIQQNRLNELYDINASADSVSIMLTLQKEKKESFEKEMELERKQLNDQINEAKQKWDKEKKEYDVLLKEEKDRLQKQQKREDEEYAYNLNLARKKDVDQYELKKAALEKELTDRKTKFEQEITSREQAVIAAETELKELREKVALQPKQLEQSIKESVAEATEKLQTTYKFETQLKLKEVETEIKLRDQDILNLKAKIKDLDTQLQQQSSKAEQADKSAKDIAIKAIESSSSYKVFERSKENREETGK